MKSTHKSYILMPDSFKGTMSSAEVCKIMRDAIEAKKPGSHIRAVPIADGGEGTVDCFIEALGGKKTYVEVTGPYGDKIKAFYGDIGETAVVEMAAAAGFTASLDGKKDPSSATTFGVGELIKAAINSGKKKIILGLGGSCTNDGGAGMAAALGTLFYDKDGKEFIPTGKNLKDICRIENRKTEAFLAGTSIDVMCDINNPLYGKSGAAYVFAPQKGADETMVRMLDDNLRAFAQIIKDQIGKDITDLKGGGAAGGMGAGAYALLGAELKQGIDVILDMIDFETLLKDCDAVFTGEGSFDRQSLGGKVAVGIASRAKKAGVPVIVVAGRLDESLPEDLSYMGITAAYKSSQREYKSDEELLVSCKDDLRITMEKVMEEI